MDERIERTVEHFLDQPEHTVHERLNAAGILIDVLAEMLFEQEVLDREEFHRIKTRYTADLDQAMAEAKRRRQKTVDPHGREVFSDFFTKFFGG